MSIIMLNPLCALSADTLNKLLLSHRTVAVFKQNYVYTLADKTQVKLTSTLVVRDLHSSSSELCYFVLSEKRIGCGGFANVFDLNGVITYQSDNNQYLYQQLDDHLGQWILKEFGAPVYFNGHVFRNKVSLAQVKREALLSKELPHLRAAPLLGGNNRRYIMMQKFSGTELFDVLNDNKDMAAINRIELALSLINALQKQVHNYELVHCDIKPENILVDLSVQPYKVNIIDVAFSKRPGTPCGSSFQGTDHYIAPECASYGALIHYSADVYALGRVLQFLFGFYAWHNDYDRDYNLTRSLAAQDRELINQNLEAMVVKLPHKRASLSEAALIFRQLLSTLASTESLLNEGAALPAASLTPFDFFAPASETATATKKIINNNEFELLIIKSIESYEKNRKAQINPAYLLAINRCHNVTDLILLVLEVKNNRGTLITSNSFICYFFQEAESMHLLAPIKQELMIDDLNINLLTVKELSSLEIFFGQENNTVEHYGADAERRKLQALLEDYVDYIKGDTLGIELSV